MVFRWSLSSSKSTQVSRTLLSILADLSNLVVCFVYLSSDFQVFQSVYKSFGDRSKCTNYNWYQRQFHVHNFFNTLAGSIYLSLFSALFQFYSVLYSHIHIHNTCGNIVNNNERTNTLLYKIYTSHTLFSKGLRKGWRCLCVRGELETETDCHVLNQSSSRDHSSSSFAFWLCCSTRGLWGPQALSLQADSHAGTLSPNWLQLRMELELTRTERLTDSSRLWHLFI